MFHRLGYVKVHTSCRSYRVVAHGWALTYFDLGLDMDKGLGLWLSNLGKPHFAEKSCCETEDEDFLFLLIPFAEDTTNLTCESTLRKNVQI